MNIAFQYFPILLRRALATVIDYLIFVMLLCLYYFIFNDIPEWKGDFILFLKEATPNYFVMAIIWFLYFPFVESKLGYTPGKGLFDLVVIADDPAASKLSGSFLRRIMDPIDFFFGVPAIILSLVTVGHKRLGDLVSNSRVIREDDVPVYTVTQPLVSIKQESAVRYGGFWSRFWANLIDMLIFSILTVASWFILRTENAFFYAPWTTSLAAAILLYTIWMHARFGATLGKMMLGLSVRRLDFTDIGWKESFMRSIVDVGFYALGTINTLLALSAASSDELAMISVGQADIYLSRYHSPIISNILWLSYVWTWSEVVVLFFNTKKRALHDYIAGTVVVVEESLPEQDNNPAG